MKPSFILIKHPEGYTALNSQDMRAIIFRDGNRAEACTSSGKVSFPCTDYMRDRIRGELERLYNVTELYSGGTDGGASKNHSVLTFKPNSDTTVILWPKAIKVLSRVAGAVRVEAAVARGFESEWMVSVTPETKLETLTGLHKALGAIVA